MKKWLSLFSALALTIVMCIGMGIALPVSAEEAEAQSPVLVLDLNKFEDSTAYKELILRLDADSTDGKDIHVSFEYYYEAQEGTDGVWVNYWLPGGAGANQKPAQLNTTGAKATYSETISAGDTGSVSSFFVLGNASVGKWNLSQRPGKLYIWNFKATLGDDPANIVDAFAYSTSGGDQWQRDGWYSGAGYSFPDDMKDYLYFATEADLPFNKVEEDENASPVLVLDLNNFKDSTAYKELILRLDTDTTDGKDIHVSFDYYYEAPAGTDGVWVNYWLPGGAGANQFAEQLGTIGKEESYSTTIPADSTGDSSFIVLGNAGVTPWNLSQRPAKLYIWNFKATLGDDPANIVDAFAYSTSGEGPWERDGWYSGAGYSFPDDMKDYLYFVTEADLPFNNVEEEKPEGDPVLIVDLTKNNGRNDARNKVIYNMLDGIEANGKEVTISFDYYYDSAIGGNIRVGLDDMGRTNVDNDKFITVCREETTFSSTWSVGVEGDLLFRIGRNDVNGYLNDKSGKLYIWNLSITVEGDDTNWIAEDAYQYNTDDSYTTEGANSNWHINYTTGWMAFVYRSSNQSEWLYFGTTNDVPSRNVVETEETLEIGAAGFYNSVLNDAAALRYYFSLTTNFDGENETITVGENTYTVKDIRALLVANTSLTALERDDVSVDMIDGKRVLDVDITTFRAEDVDDENGTKTYAFSVLLTNIKKANVAKDVTARAYLVCEDADGNTVYVYGESQYTSVQEMYDVAVEAGDAINAEFAAWMA